MEDTSSSTDEYFGTLGGSLMRDLLADLQVEDNDWSLEQLEKELASLDQEPSLEQQKPLNSLNAASLIVSHAQERSSSITTMPLLPGTATIRSAPSGLANTTDAWSLSLQKFTSLSLQDDFLAADSARKQNQSQDPTSQGISFLLGAEDYDIKEKQIFVVPAGLGGASADVKHFTSQQDPITPSRNSISIGSENTKTSNNATFLGNQAVQRPEVNTNNQPTTDETKKIYPIVGLNSSILPSKIDATFPANNAFGNLPIANSIPPAGMVPTQGTVIVSPQQQASMIQPHPQGVALGLHVQHAPPIAVPMQMPMPMNVPTMGITVTAPPTGVVVGTAMSTAGPAWQTPRVGPLLPLSSPQQYQMKVFCNPYPSAPPIPATALISSCMSSRDIAYVVHAILKPILAAGISEDDYYLQYIKRRAGCSQANPINPKRVKDINHEMVSRQSKSKEWASEKSVLGHVTKSNIARPRALIATPQPSADEDNTEQKQRANLWKSRVYCDQAYQSFQNVVDIWRLSPPGGGIPPQVQLHLVKLMKCMGIVLDNEKKMYTVGGGVLKLVVKLRKGRTLISRVLEQALLPPNVVQVFLPVLLETITSLSMNSNENSSNNAAKQTGNGIIIEDPSIERLFRAMIGIILQLKINGETLLKCFQIFLSHGKAAFSTKVRMECLHSLLQKGASVIPQSPSEGTKEAWGNAEQKFMLLLQ